MSIMPRKRSMITPAQCIEQCQLLIGCEDCGLRLEIREIIQQLQQQNIALQFNHFNSLDLTRISSRAKFKHSSRKAAQARKFTPTFRRPKNNIIRKIFKRGRKPWLPKHDNLLKGCLSLFGDDLNKIRLFLSEFSDGTIRKKISLVGWKKYVLANKTGICPGQASKPSITNSDTLDFLKQKASRSSSVGLKMIVPQPSLAQTLLKITSIDVDGQFAEPEPVHGYMPSIECFDLAQFHASNALKHLPKSQCHAESLIFPEKNYPHKKFSVFSKNKTGFDENIFRFKLTQSHTLDSTLNAHNSISIDSAADVQTSPFDVNDFNSPLARRLERNIIGGRFSSVVKFGSAIDLASVEKP